MSSASKKSSKQGGSRQEKKQQGEGDYATAWTIIELQSNKDARNLNPTQTLLNALLPEVVDMEDIEESKKPVKATAKVEALNKTLPEVGEVDAEDPVMFVSMYYKGKYVGRIRVSPSTFAYVQSRPALSPFLVSCVDMDDNLVGTRGVKGGQHEMLMNHKDIYNRPALLSQVGTGYWRLKNDKENFPTLQDETLQDVIVKLAGKHFDQWLKKRERKKSGAGSSSLKALLKKKKRKPKKSSTSAKASSSSSSTLSPPAPKKKKVKRSKSESTPPPPTPIQAGAQAKALTQVPANA
jgi:hypothetical protein